MADQSIVNGSASDGDEQASENFYDFDRENAIKVSDLSRDIEILGQEKLDLVRENEESEQKIKHLISEISVLKNDEAKMKEKIKEMEIEIEQSQSAKNAVEAIASRAAELEIEVARLQHDLISAMNDGDEANSEVRELKKSLAETKSKFQLIETENQLVIEGLKKEVEDALKAEIELEKKLQVIQETERGMKADNFKAEEHTKTIIKEKTGLEKSIKELQSVISKNALELENQKKEKLAAEASLKASEEKVKEMELKMIQLQKETKEAEKVVTGLKEKTVEAVNGITDRSYGVDDEVKELNLQWPAMAAAATGTIVVAGAICYLHYAMRR